MKLLWPIIRDTAIYYWEEIFYLILCNLITTLTLAPGIIVLWVNLQGEMASAPIIYVPLSIIVWSGLPYTLFGLFWTVYEISEGKAVKFATFFKGGKQFLKEAYTWWGINVAVITLLAVNVGFYRSLETGWSIYAAMLFAGLLVTWLLIQLFALTLYPRLVTPGFKLATTNAVAILGENPLPTLLAGGLSLVLAIGGLIIPPLGWVAAVALIATLVNMTTRKILQGVPTSQNMEISD